MGMLISPFFGVPNVLFVAAGCCIHLQDRLNLFLYYKHNYAYEAVKNWTDIDRSQGHLTVQVDDSWFPAGPEPTDKSWTYYGLYLPAGIDPAAELVNPDSQYPRPFNFTVVRKYTTVYLYGPES